MKHLEESHKHLEDETDMDLQLEREMQEQQEEQEERELCLALQMEVESRGNIPLKKTLTKVFSRFSFVFRTNQKKQIHSKILLT